MNSPQIIEARPIEVAAGQWAYRIDLNTQPYPRKGATIRIRTKGGKTFDKKYQGEIVREDRKGREITVLAS